jgi:inhibitor of KinA
LKLSPLGDRAIVVQLGETIDEATHRLVRALCARLEESPVGGMMDYVPAYASVTVHYDPAHSAGERAGGPGGPYDRVAAELTALLATPGMAAPPTPRLVEIPVRYGGDAGPDLEAVARSHGLTPEEVVRIHAGGEYLVYMIGFAPGFPYLGGLDERLATPRRATPRLLVPASSVGIAERQTGIYPIASPGGWQLIGRTPLRLFDPAAEFPTLLRMGDRIRFRAISDHELRRWPGEA